MSEVRDEKMTTADETAVSGSQSSEAPRTTDANVAGDEYHIDPVAEAKLVRKLDFIVYPVFFVIYTMSFLDRINISNARIQGMTVDIDLSGSHFNVALFVCPLEQEPGYQCVWVGAC